MMTRRPFLSRVSLKERSAERDAGAAAPSMVASKPAAATMRARVLMVGDIKARRKGLLKLFTRSTRCKRGSFVLDRDGARFVKALNGPDADLRGFGGCARIAPRAARVVPRRQNRCSLDVRNACRNARGAIRVN